jgi:putative Ca2+/H+ antiporter (TMEM165/GDT1 family)
VEALLLSIAVGALGEMGDKTQILTVLLAARLKRPIPIIFGLFVSTLVNYAIAGLLGEWVGTVISASSLRWCAGLSFLAIALLTLKTEQFEASLAYDGRYSVFALTVLSTFLAEMGDKTQLATVVLAAKYGALAPVVAGMTAGVMVADAPLILVAKTLAMKTRFRSFRFVVAGLFTVLGLATLLGFPIA